MTAAYEREGGTTTQFDLLLYDDDAAAAHRVAVDAAVDVEASFTYAKRNHRRTFVVALFGGIQGNAATAWAWLASLILTYGTSHVAFPRRPLLRGWLNICLACPATNYEPPLRAKSAAAKSFLTDAEWSVNRPPSLLSPHCSAIVALIPIVRP